MAVMRAVVQDELGGPEVLHLAEVERPEPGPTEILVRVHAAGVNPTDWKSRESGGLTGLKPPFILGWDVSGTVEAVGASVRLYAPGDEVYGMPRFPHQAGGYGQYVTAPARHFDFKPQSLTHVEAAAVPLTGLTAYQALVDNAGVREGQRVLVHAAAGGVGHLAVQIAKARGAYVIGTASEAKHGFLRSIGVDEAIDYRSTDFAAAVSDIDIVVDPIGGEYTAKSASVLKDGGFLMSVIPGDLPDSERERLHTGFVLVEPDWSGMRALSALINEGRLRPTIAETYPLEEVAKAHESLQTGRTAGKIVLTVD
ncbi:NADPH:quinone reductase-like Zn-dependent oxidoreductase [Glycomyces artemisiae]|uniref:NADPH:quinone reductase-like Zn-dependent oxidoreductase n=2 Tax=Glycomyces artemisiae TaxID=1076443 RepID=A0A2T0UWI1_9ACTN|nr:NADP-dependent oxidoreductase [Glycomyces artemisiae]PRY62282.1 NADPH:quinone reductase-like Zn-dependent oxidoreductase [Glycomyces artemisiae]